jgi:hypothetical protein
MVIGGFASLDTKSAFGYVVKSPMIVPWNVNLTENSICFQNE